MTETQTAFKTHVWAQDRNESEIRQMQDDKRAIWKIVQELGLDCYEDGMLVWIRRQGV